MIEGRKEGNKVKKISSLVNSWDVENRKRKVMVDR